MTIGTDERVVFKKLASEWLADVKHVSSIHQMVLHPAYQQIIGMGEKAIPLILQELLHRPNHWFWALKAISRCDPVNEEDRGRIEAMRAAWLKWGEDKGYIKRDGSAN